MGNAIKEMKQAISHLSNEVTDSQVKRIIIFNNISQKNLVQEHNSTNRYNSQFKIFSERTFQNS